MLKGQARELAQSLLDLLYPPRCEVCGTLGTDAFCAECLAQVEPHVPPECECCGLLLQQAPAQRLQCPDCAQTRRHYRAARAAAIHHGTLRTAIINFKFNNCRRLQRPLARLLADRIEAEPPGGVPFLQLDCLVPVPLHPRRKQWRGFDQAYLLASELSELVGLPVVTALARTRPTTPQLQLAPNERERNVQGAFAPVGSALTGMRILLLDDVYTTGATVNQAAKAALAGGATEVYALTVSRPPPPWHPAAAALEPGDV